MNVCELQADRSVMIKMLSFVVGGRKKSSGDHGSKSVGCMSGIFHLLHGRALDRKRLTQAGKSDRTPTSGQQFKETTTTHFCGNAPKQKQQGILQPGPKSSAVQASDLRQLSSSNLRSPTLPPDMRRRSREAPVCWPEKSEQGKPGVVARLMGLDDFPPAAEMPTRDQRPETTSEKRRRILGALEKCDEDLRTLRKIIEAIERGETCGREPEEVPPHPVAEADGGIRSSDQDAVPANLTVDSPRHGERCTVEAGCEQPSPVSVLDNRTFRFEATTPTKEQDECEPEVKQCTNYMISNRSFPVKDSKYKRLTADAGAKKGTTTGTEGGCRKIATPYSGSVAEDAKEVLKDCERWERVEFHKVGLALENAIYGSLVEEIMGELGYYCKPSLVFFKSRKKLLF